MPLPPDARERMAYDAAGRLTSYAPNSGDTVTYAHGELNNLKETAIDSDQDRNDGDGTVVESERYVYNESNQLVSAELYDGKKTTSVSYTYDEDGNLISEIGRDGTDKAEEA